MGGSHEGGGLFVACDEEFDGRLPQRFDKIEILLAGDAEDMCDSLVFEGRDQQV
jgi:hypothetical protein